MKILYILPILLFCNISFAQELPELSMKNGLVFYEFKHTLNNQKKCLSTYSTVVMASVMKKNGLILKDESYNGYGYGFVPGNWSNRKGGYKAGYLELNCSDTVAEHISGMPMFSLATCVFRPGRKNAEQYTVTAHVELIFVNKNEYVLKFKDFQSNGPLGEMYENFINTEKKSIYLTRFFNDVNFFVKYSDEIYLKSITEAYQADDL
jgi:hypothetical protein